MVRHLDLFSGIDGFALAASWVWGDEHEIVSFCDNDKAAQIVLKKHWSGVPIHDDIKTLNATKWRGTVDLVTGGFPCQPFSCAGKRGGTADDRYLWPEMLRVIAECKPRWVLGENVPGIIPMELESVCASLEGKGYEVWPLVIPACAVDAPHRRARVWIVGYSEGRSKCRLQQCRDGMGQEAEGEWSTDNDKLDRSGADMAHNGSVKHSGDMQASSRKDGRRASQSSLCREAVADAARLRCGQKYQNSGRSGKRAGETEERRGFAYGCKWATEPDVGRVAHGVPYRVDRLRLLGNAIVPQVAAEIFKAMKAVDGL